MDILFNKDRFYINNDQGGLIAEITFEFLEPKLISVDHTFTDTSLRGQGIARKLVERVARYAREEGLKVSATCPYAVKVLSEDEFKDIYRR